MGVEVRCSIRNHLVGVAESLVGRVACYCNKCRTSIVVGLGKPDPARLLCECGKWLATGHVDAGRVIVSCRHCHALSAIGSDNVGHLIERPALRPWVAPTRPVHRKPLKPEEILAEIEERWRLMRMDGPRRSVDIAVGLRFDVFNRDGFRCVYCGRGPGEGVYLEADHRTARSQGGPDTLANLVTACWDCNRGKAAKRIKPLDVA